MAVIRQGRVILARGYGLADRERRIPISSATVFEVGWMSKQFTGLAIAMLESEGRLSPDHELQRWLPELHPSLARLTNGHGKRGESRRRASDTVTDGQGGSG